MDELQKAESAFRKAHAAGDTAKAKVLAAEVRRLRALAAGTTESSQALMRPGQYARNTAEGRDERARKEQEARDFSDTFEGDLGAQFRAGIGRRMHSAMRAVLPESAQRALGIVPAEEAKVTDRALLDTTAGSLGDATGMAVVAAPAIPFTPATVPGAIVAGGVTGAALTEGDALDRLKGGLEGAAGGGIGQSLPIAYRAGRGFVRGITEPLTQAGSRRIAGRTFQRFGLDSDQLANLEASGMLDGLSPTGARLTLAELPGLPTNTRRGIASLERGVSSLDPAGAGAQFAARQEANNAARTDALGVLTGTSVRPRSTVRRLDQIARGQPTLARAEGTRAGNARSAYDGAYEAGIVPGAAEAMAPQIEELLRRPSVQVARGRAAEAAQEMGLNEVPENSVRGLHLLKKELDTQRSLLSRAGDDTAAERVGATAAGFDDLLENLSPLYQQARRGFQFDSVPVTRAEIGARLMDTTRQATRDFAGNRPLRAQAFSRALNDEGGLISNATGFRGNADADLAGVLTPTQTGTLGAVRDELEMLANLDKAANGPGAQTAKLLGVQSLLRQTAQPFGRAGDWASNILNAQLVDRLPGFLGHLSGEPRIQAQVAQGLLTPRQAFEMLLEAQRADQLRPGRLAQGITIRGQQQLANPVARTLPALLGVTAADASSQ